MEQLHTTQNTITDEPQLSGNIQMPEAQQLSSEQIVEVINVSENDQDVTNICKLPSDETVQICNTPCVIEEAVGNIEKANALDEVDKMDQNQIEVIKNSATNEIVDAEKNDIEANAKQIQDKEEGSISSLPDNQESQEILAIADQKNENVDCIDEQMTTEVQDVMEEKNCTEINANLNSDSVPDPVCKISQNEEQSSCTALNQVDEHDKDQNCTVIMETEPPKLGNENSEVVLVTVASVNEDTTQENITIVAVEESNIPIDNGNQPSQAGEEIHEVLPQKDGLHILHCTEESDHTVIEVISTEILNVQEDSEDGGNQVVKESVKTESDVVTKIEILSEDVDAINSNTSELKEEVTEEQVDLNDINNPQEICLNYKPKFCLKEKKNVSQSKDNSNNTVDKLKWEKVSSSLHETKTETQNKSRSVIQDIFDDWGVEAPDDDIQTSSKVQDTVEIELKTLLDDTKAAKDSTKQGSVSTSEEEKISENITPADILNNSKKVLETESPSTVITLDPEEKTVESNQNASTSVNKNQHNSPSSQNLGKATKNDSQKNHASQEPLLSSGTIVKTRNRHLTSHITSAAKVTEALKQRLKEKQKIVEPPKPDIFFVKKITQRLSSKLSGVPIHPVPALIPLSPTHPSSIEHSQGKSTEVIPIDIDKESKENEDGKESNSDNKELLAILEGDVDPDWSNLKPPILTVERKSPTAEHVEHPSPPKLDPLVERELALKQLLELPAMPVKKGSSKKKKTFKPAASKVSKEAEQKINDSQEKVVVNLVSPIKESSANDSNMDVDSSKDLDKSSSRDVIVCSPTQDVRADESRSGRKRKPTEKAREHEETTKRQKVYKGKVLFSKKSVTQVDISTDESSQGSHTEKNMLEVESTQPAPVKEVELLPVEEKKTTKTETQTKGQPPLAKTQNNKKSKQSMMKKGSQPISKRKMVMKKMIQKKMISNKSGNLKSKLTTSPKKSGAKVVSKSQKRPMDSTTADAKPKKKIINEIDRLLQDEGVVNLLYDVEQPDKKRLIPITKSQAKVMDLQKAQRELKIRKKLVRNAVLRLRTTAAGSTKASPRSKRSSVHPNDSQTEKKTADPNKSVKTSNAASATDFIIPAKIRNAADASIIIRRHSSSSFSSASGSPRVSIDCPEKQTTESAKTEEGILQTLRSNKRRHSQDESTKKAKKKAVPKADSDSLTAVVVENKLTATTRSNKKMDQKKSEKKEAETANVNESESNPTGKVVTRSNGAATGKVTSKSKKAVKNKTTAGKQDPNEEEETSKDEDKLSACLAEAATALSIVSSNRSGNSTVSRKGKGNAHTEQSGGKTKTETRSQFSNKEINVRRHGNLVQLILTPSSPTKIKNSLTLQVMHEFREILSILKKDEECRVVLFTSTGTSFCEGLELSELLHANKEDRRVAAEEMANSVKEFVKCLATFNKPIVAGVQGAAVGLGVTMLPLFDLVIASDKATFSTPYGKLAQIAEGAAVFTLSHILGTAITSELLLGGRTLTANEALRAGLVTRVLWPDRFQVELLPSLKVMSEQSSQSIEATKALLRHSLRKKLDAALESETYLLIQHWCSAECQSAIKDYIDGKVQ